MVENIDSMKPYLTLDVGCGHNIFHVKRGNIGIDLQKGKCDVQSSANYLPFKDKVFDKVLLFHVLEHLFDFSALGDIKRVLKNKGILIIEIPNVLTFKTIKSLFLKDEYFYGRWSKDHVSCFRPYEIENLLRHFNLEIEKYQYVNSNTKVFLDLPLWKKVLYVLIFKIYPQFKTAIRFKVKIKKEVV